MWFLIHVGVKVKNHVSKRGPWDEIINRVYQMNYAHGSRLVVIWYRSILPVSFHYDDVIMTTLASQITSLAVVYSTVYSDADQRKHQSSASLAFVRGIHRGPVNSPHKWPVTRKMFPFDDVIMQTYFTDTGTVVRSHRSNRPVSQCTCPISHNTPFRTEMCTFLFWMVYCGI